MEAKVSILLVDDQPERLLSYESILERLGHKLVRARSGLEALEKLMKDEFAAVLLDVSTPGMDGFETAGLIHEHPRFARTPIIVVTDAHVSELDRLKGYKLGAVDYVSLPVVPEVLRSKVAVLVELHCQRRELEELNRALEEANTTLQAQKARELEAMNQTLKEADRHKDEFLAVLAHDLRNPLAPIRNAVEVMRRSAIDDAQLTWARDVIERQVKHLSRLVDDLLDVSRITRGNINLMREPLTVAAIVSRALETVQPIVTEQRHELVLDLPEEEITVEGDLTRLTQVLGNLLNNAAKYTDPGGRIVLTARRRGTQLELRVTDTGIGIPSELLPRLFNLFTQVEGAMHRSHGGLGIGLALVRQLVSMHGGTVTAHSAGPGCGSEFIVTLPAHLTGGMESSGQMPQPSAPSADDRRGHRILLADDNRDALDSLATLLQCEGHEVFTAVDGAEALELASSCRPDVMLLDIGMPKLDGYEVARRVRQQPWGGATVLIALTGWGQEEDRRRSREVGFDSHLVKPLDLDALTVLLARLPPAVLSSQAC